MKFEIDLQLPDGTPVTVDVEAPNEQMASQAAQRYVAEQHQKLQGLDFEPREATMQDPGAFEAGLIGMGRTGQKLLRGAENLFADDPRRAEIQQEQTQEDLMYAPLSEKHPVSTFVGEMLPYMTPMGGTMGTVAGSGAMGLSTYQDDLSSQGIAGGIDTALAALPYGLGKGYKALRGAGGEAIEGALEFADPALAGKSQTVSPRLLERADELGYQTTIGERTGNKTLQKFEASMESSPWTAGPFDRMRQKNQMLTNRVAAETIGFDEASAVTDDMLGEAADRISEQFTNLTRGNDIPIDNRALDDMMDVIAESKRGLFDPADLEQIVGRIVDRASDGNLTSEQYQQFSSQLGKKIRQLFRGESSNPDLAMELGKVKNILDDMVERSLGADELSKFREARQQWKQLTRLEKPGVLSPETGDVSGRSLANVLRRDDKGGYLRGRDKSDLYDVARMSKQFRPAVGDSGTATRMSIPSMIGSSPLGIPAYVGASMYAGAPTIWKPLKKSGGILLDKSKQIVEGRLGQAAAGTYNVYDEPPTDPEDDQLILRGLR